jgi:L-aspartate oxidase
LTREGGHHKNRVLHCGGDATGLGITKQLYAVARKRKNITLTQNHFLTDILTGENGAAGVLTLDKRGKPHYFSAAKVVVASAASARSTATAPIPPAPPATASPRQSARARR